MFVIYLVKTVVKTQIQLKWFHITMTGACKRNLKTKIKSLQLKWGEFEFQFPINWIFIKNFPKRSKLSTYDFELNIQNFNDSHYTWNALYAYLNASNHQFQASKHVSFLILFQLNRESWQKCTQILCHKVSTRLHTHTHFAIEITVKHLQKTIRCLEVQFAIVLLLLLNFFFISYFQDWNMYEFSILMANLKILNWVVKVDYTASVYSYISVPIYYI